jgi:20S proteasome alpha/beta subunit
MTLVAAFRRKNGGLILCADREENDGTSKREVDKIYQIKLENNRALSANVFLAGSGPSSVITRAFSDVETELLSAIGKGTDIEKEHRSLIETVLRRLHRDYKLNLKDSYLDMLVIYAPFPQSPGRAPVLYRTEYATLVPVSFYAALGSGKSFCDYFTDRMYDEGFLDDNALITLTTFIFREAENYLHGIGFGTDVYMIGGDFIWRRIGKDLVKEFADKIPSLLDMLRENWKRTVSASDWIDK